jgi:hypothetical protein
VQGTRECPPILFVGVWDTVGALGAPGFLGRLFNRNKYRYHDIGLNSHILHAYHALAIDERRTPFAPDLWTRPDGWSGTLEQAWFAGAHSNVGGGQTPDGLANEALHWLVEKAEALGLEFDASFLSKYTPCFNSTLHDSMNGKYRLLGTHVRTIGRLASGGEVVHQSAIDRLKDPACAYAPQNLKTFLDSAAAAAARSNTARIARGSPCPPLAGVGS